jgi:hypothetical protein
MTIEWDISGGCPPDDKLKYYFFGTYDARIIGKCREEDLKNGDVGE